MHNNRKSSYLDLLPLVLVAVGVLLIALVIAWQFARQSAATAAVFQPTSTTNPNSLSKEIKRVSLADAKAAFDNHSAVFLDVRDADSYHAGHIPGAKNIPVTELEGRTNELDPSQWIIAYCS